MSDGELWVCTYWLVGEPERESVAPDMVAETEDTELVRRFPALCPELLHVRHPERQPGERRSGRAVKSGAVQSARVLPCCV